MTDNSGELCAYHLIDDILKVRQTAVMVAHELELPGLYEAAISGDDKRLHEALYAALHSAWDDIKTLEEKGISDGISLDISASGPILFVGLVDYMGEAKRIHRMFKLVCDLSQEVKEQLVSRRDLADKSTVELMDMLRIERERMEMEAEKSKAASEDAKA